MSTKEITVPSTGAAGQATQIEQARAMAEVHAMMVSAHDFPRSTVLAWDRMREACADPGLAAVAFFRFPQGGEQVTGPTVHLARELAICWGNIDFGIRELARDDYRLTSEMQASAVDIENNIRSFSGFIVPHKRDLSGGRSVALSSMREVYNNNANAGARRLRECIYAVLPRRFRKEAERLCLATLESGADEEGKIVPLHERKEWIIDRFGGKGITIKQLEEKVGLPESRWRAADAAHFRIIWKSLAANETTLEAEFPHAFTRADDVAKAVTVPPAEQPGPAGAATVERWKDVQAPKTGNPALDVANAAAAAVINSMGSGEPMPGELTPGPDYVCDVCESLGIEYNGDHLQDVCPNAGDSE